MRQKLSLLTKTMLLLGALMAGSGSAWAEEKTSTLVFTAKCNGSGTADDGVAWTVTSDGTESTYDDTKGIHYGTNSASVTYIQLKTSGFTKGTITKVIVNASGNNSPSLNVTVGGSAFGTTATGITTTNAAYTFNGSADAGEIVVKLAKSSKMNKAIYIKSVAVTYDDGPAKSAHELAWSASTKDVTYSEEPYGLPTLTNPHNLPISYSSSNADVATIDASTGDVTVKNVTGSTTISATTTGDATYAAGSVSYTLNVTHKIIIEDGMFDFSMGSDYGSGVTYGSTSNIGTGASTWTAVNVTLQVAGRNIWYEDDGTLRLYKTTSGGDPCGQITLNCPTGYVITKIEFTMGSKSSLTTTQGSYSSGTWTGAAQSVTFTSPSDPTYIKTISVTYTNKLTKTVESYGWATYATPASVSFAAGDAYVVTAVDEIEGTITIVGVTAVPANTPLLLKGEGVKTVSVLDYTPDAPTPNLLAIGDGTAPATGYYYVLAKDGDGAGFKQWMGDAAVLKDRVVLVLSQPQSGGGDARMLHFVESDTQGISAALMNKDTMNDVVYDLQGRSVARPTKGLYIVNGKKVIMK